MGIQDGLNCRLFLFFCRGAGNKHSANLDGCALGRLQKVFGRPVGSSMIEIIALGQAEAELAANAGFIFAVDTDSDKLNVDFARRLDQSFHLLLPLRTFIEAPRQGWSQFQIVRGEAGLSF